MTDILGGVQEPGPPVTRKELLAIHDDLCQMAKSLMDDKNHDYTGEDGDSPFDNFESASSVLGIPLNDRRAVCLARLVEKCSRLSTWIKQGRFKVQDEDCRQLLADMINYPILIAGMEVDSSRVRRDVTHGQGSS